LGEIMQDEKKFLIALGRISGISSRKIINLIQKKFDSAFDLIQASEEELSKFFRRRAVISRIKSLLKESDLALEETLQALEVAKEHSIHVHTYFDKEYPASLKKLDDPPLYLFIKGQILPQDENSFSIIGSRNPTLHGRLKAREIARDLAMAGYTIVSGLARGIDTEAHVGAMEEGGRTIAVLGSGIIAIYPPENSELAEDISKSGAIISESFPEERVKKWTLQKRNKLNSGLSMGSIFIEGNQKSGTQWQIKYSKKQGKVIFALQPPDPSRSPAFIPQMILKNGGVPIKGAKDIIAYCRDHHLSIKSRNKVSLIIVQNNHQQGA